MAPTGSNQDTAELATAKQSNYRFALISLTVLFFMWGFLTVLNDILIPYLKEMFDLNYMEAMLIQFCFFSAYFIVSYPAGKLVGKIGYQKGIVVGLSIAALGCVLFYPAAGLAQYWLFLAALFVLASGITILQVSANPYVTVLGDSKTASSRLTMTQAFNSLGTTLGPLFGGAMILSVINTEGGASAADHAHAVQLPYLGLAAALFLLAIIFSYLKLPKLGFSHQQVKRELTGSAWQYRHLVLGAIGIFVYVGAEVGIGSLMVNFISQDNIGALSAHKAAHYVSFYWGGAMIGRFIGAVVMQKVDAGKALAFNAAIAMLLLVITMLSSGHVAMFAVILIGLFNSIMFPTIFSLALKGLGDHTSQGSGILCLAIVGGAVLPLLQGGVADIAGIQVSFIIPLLCFAYILFYGLVGSKPRQTN